MQTKTDFSSPDDSNLLLRVDSCEVQSYNFWQAMVTICSHAHTKAPGTACLGATLTLIITLL